MPAVGHYNLFEEDTPMLRNVCAITRIPSVGGRSVSAGVGLSSALRGILSMSGRAPSMAANGMMGSDPNAMLQILHECQLEAEMLQQHIAQKTLARKRISQKMLERSQEITTINEELCGIRCEATITCLPKCMRMSISRFHTGCREKTALSAGQGLEHSTVLTCELADQSALLKETGTLARTLSDSVAELRRRQAESVLSDLARARELPMLRGSFRKRCRDRMESTARLTCSLLVLEASLVTRLGTSPPSSGA
jgi:hypothetical protein